MLVGSGAVGKVIRRNTSRGLVIEKHIDMQQNDTIKLRSVAREIKAYLRLGLHPCIAKYHSNHFNGTALIIEMEYAAGGDLHTWAANHSRRRAALGDDELLRMALRFVGHVAFHLSLVPAARPHAAALLRACHAALRAAVDELASPAARLPQASAELAAQR